MPTVMYIIQIQSTSGCGLESRQFTSGLACLDVTGLGSSINGMNWLVLGGGRNFLAI